MLLLLAVNISFDRQHILTSEGKHKNSVLKIQDHSCFPRKNGETLNLPGFGRERLFCSISAAFHFHPLPLQNEIELSNPNNLSFLILIYNKQRSVAEEKFEI